jgi:crossover junction endodeoxyribonuclease RuvC
MDSRFEVSPAELAAGPGSVILGIDPGMSRTGYGVLEVLPQGFHVLDAGVISTSSRQPLEVRLEKIFRSVRAVVAQHSPRVLAIEKVYSHYRHPETAIMMAHVRGVICCVAAMAGIPVVGYSATDVKKSITGSGRASKYQVQHAVCSELGLEEILKPADLTDALALGVCHARVSRVSGERWAREQGEDRRLPSQEARIDDGGSPVQEAAS